MNCYHHLTTTFIYFLLVCLFACLCVCWFVCLCVCLQKTNGAGQLLQGTMVGWHVEVVAPGVFSAIQAWYCGGPRITRTVIATDPAGNGTTGAGTELELFPLRLVVCTCDERGSTIDPTTANNVNVNSRHHRNYESSAKQQQQQQSQSPWPWTVREVLVSKAATVGDLLRELVRLDHSHSRGGAQGMSGGSSHSGGQGLGYASAAASVILPSANTHVILDAAADGGQPNPLSSSGNGSGAVGASIDISHVRLWNYAPVQWKQQFVLGQGQQLGPEQAQVQGHPTDHPLAQVNAFVDELTLEAARLQDGQRVLLERRLSDGTWPRQRLQEAFEQQQQQQAADNEAGTAASSSMNVAGSSADNNGNNEIAGGMSSSQSSPALLAAAGSAGPDAALALTQWHGRRVNEGKVGLENLGNTCYLNSSVQVLTHLRPWAYIPPWHYPWLL